MTTDKDQERVSAAYRDLPQASSPPALDRRVLAAARRESRPRYSVVRAWIRPLAWAATVGLSLAILLEFTLFNAAPPSPEPQPASGAPPAEQAGRDADVMRAKEEDAVVRPSMPRRAPAAARLESREAAARPPCDYEARRTAASWYACVEALRDEGRDEDAVAELAALREAFPDFEIAPAR